MGCALTLVLVIVAYTVMTMIMDGLLYLLAMFIPGMTFVWWHGVVACAIVCTVLMFAVIMEEKKL